MIDNKKIIVFGAGIYGKLALRYFGTRNVHCFADNKKGGSFYLGKHVVGFDELLKVHRDYDIVIAAGSGVSPILKKQCDEAGIATRHINDILSVNDFESNPALSAFKDIHKGQRCFLIGNGPSLKAEDLERIYEAGDISMGCNLIYQVFPQTHWRPSYYFVADPNMLIADADSIGLTGGSKRFIFNANLDFAGERNEALAPIAALEDTFIFEKIGVSYVSSAPRFSDDPSRCVYVGYTVMNAMIQWAAYMGFTEIYLLGVDCTFFTPASTENNHFYARTEDDKLDRLTANTSNLGTDGILLEWKKMYEFADAHSRERDFRIYNATRGGMLEAFERIPFDGLFP